MTFPPANLGRESNPWGNVIQQRLVRAERAIDRLLNSSAMTSIANLTGSISATVAAISQIPTLVTELIAGATIQTSQLNGTLDQSVVTGTWSKGVSTGDSIATSGTVSATDINSSGTASLNAVTANAIGSIPIYNNNLVAGTIRDLQITSVDGRFGYIPSSQRFKSGIRPLDLSEPSAITLLELVEYWYTEDPEQQWRVGVIAEQAHALGYEWLVDYDDEGKPFGFRYSQLALAYLPYLRNVESRLKALESVADEGAVSGEGALA